MSSRIHYVANTLLGEAVLRFATVLERCEFRRGRGVARRTVRCIVRCAGTERDTTDSAKGSDPTAAWAMSAQRWVSVAALIALTSCKAQLDPELATEILLRVDCGGEVCRRGRRVDVRVDKLSRDLSPTSATRLRQLSVSDTRSWPLDVPIVPRDPRSLPDSFQITVEAFDSHEGMLLAEARAITSFARASRRVLSVRLHRCGDRPLGACEPDAGCSGTRCLTCVADSCEATPIIDPNSLPVLDLAALNQAPSTQPPMHDIDSGASDAGPDVSAAGPTPVHGRAPAADGGAPTAASSRDGFAAAGGDPSPLDSGLAEDAAVPVPLAWTEPSELEQLAEDVVMPGFARNSAGDLAVAWWQDSREGYLWLQRFHHGEWEDDALSVTGSLRPSTIWVAPNVGIDGLGEAHVLALVDATSVVAPRHMEWVRWGGGDDIQLETTWQMREAPINSVPTMLSVTEDGRGVAMFSGPPVGAMGVATLFASTFDQDLWSAPADVGTLHYAQSEFPENAANRVGDYISVFTVTSESDQRVRELKILVGHLGGVPNETRVLLPEPLVDEVEVAIDDNGDAIALFALGEAQDPHVYGMKHSRTTQVWSTPERTSALTLKTGDLTLLPSGQPVAVWREKRAATMNTMNTQLVLSSYTKTRGWSPGTVIGEPFAADETSDAVAIAASPRGDLVVAWTQVAELDPGGGFGFGLFASRVTNAGMFSAPTRVAAGRGAINLVGAAWDDADHAVIVWHETEPTTQHRDLKWSRSVPLRECVPPLC